MIEFKDTFFAKDPENMNIDDIQNLTLEQAKVLCKERTTIKEHDIYFVDFGGYFGFSCLVFYKNMHIYYANDYQLHHKKITWNEDGTSTSKDYTPEELKKIYIDSLNNKLFTEAELSEPLKNYDEYTKKDHFIRNYYSMRSPYISMFFIGTDAEREARRKKTEKMHFSPVTFSYYYDSSFPAKVEKLFSALQEQRNNVNNNFEYQKSAFKQEMYNHEYSINWQADYDTLSAFGRIDYKSNSSLTDYFNQLNFNQIQRAAYVAARKEYYQECDY